MSTEFPHAPTIADVWERLDPDTRDKVSRMFVEWLRDCLKRVRHDNIALFAALLAYHKRDLAEVFSYMLKDEYALYAEQVLKVFGVL